MGKKIKKIARVVKKSLIEMFLFWIKSKMAPKKPEEPK